MDQLPEIPAITDAATFEVAVTEYENTVTRLAEAVAVHTARYEGEIGQLAAAHEQIRELLHSVGQHANSEALGDADFEPPLLRAAHFRQLDHEDAARLGELQTSVAEQYARIFAAKERLTANDAIVDAGKRFAAAAERQRQLATVTDGDADRVTRLQQARQGYEQAYTDFRHHRSIDRDATLRAISRLAADGSFVENLHHSIADIPPDLRVRAEELVGDLTRALRQELPREPRTFIGRPRYRQAVGHYRWQATELRTELSLLDADWRKVITSRVRPFEALVRDVRPSESLMKTDGEVATAWRGLHDAVSDAAKPHWRTTAPPQLVDDPATAAQRVDWRAAHSPMLQATAAMRDLTDRVAQLGGGPKAA